MLVYGQGEESSGGDSKKDVSYVIMFYIRTKRQKVSSSI